MGAPQPDVRKLPLPPGVFANGTFYEQANRWCDANLVRFVRGYVQPIGGWARLTEKIGTTEATQEMALTGRPCGALAFRASNNQAWLLMGTHSKFYAYRAGNRYDVTPSGFTAGNEHAIAVAGYGDGGYGAGTYNYGLTAFSEVSEAATWSIDVFGQTTIAVNDPTSRIIYQWLASSASTIMTTLLNAPSCTALVVTPETHIMALGTSSSYNTVAWCSAGEANTWTPATTNTAGDYQLITNGRLMAGLRLRNETLLFTDVDTHSATYSNDEFVYSFRQVGTGSGVISKRAAVAIDTRAFWMGPNGFFVYDGYVRTLPCDVWDKVYGDIDDIQRSKIWAVHNSAFNEVTWYYPQVGSSNAQISNYVTFNYEDRTWSLGALDRSAGVDSGALQVPVYLSSNGWVWQHESGTSRLATDGSQLTPYVTSGPLEVEDGGNVIRCHTFIPDERRPDDNVADSGYGSRVQYKLYAAMYPNEAEFGTAQTFYTSGPTSVRRTGRWLRLHVEERTANSSWIVGIPRIGVSVLGRR